MNNFKFPKNPFVLFLPFLMLFILFVLKQHRDVMESDEGGYIFFAQNLLNGFYSPPAPDINLWWGPGYPLILTPFVLLKTPLICITLLNAVFHYLSIVFVFKSANKFVTFKKALIFSLLWAFCYGAYFYIGLILTETFAIFLISLLLFSVVNAFENKNKKYTYAAGFLLGYIALTKVIFGYVLLLLLIGSVLLWIKNRNGSNYKRSVLVMVIALATVFPYLLYTYNLTGKIFYFGNSGGMSLYWMSNPNANEYGDWHNEKFDSNKQDGGLSNTQNLLKSTHQKDIDEVLKFKGVQKEEAYKKIAIRNIKAHPVKYLKNVVQNIGRALFGFPLTYSYQKPLLKIWYFAFLYSLILLCLLPTLKNWRIMPYSIRFILLFVFVYLGGSSLVSGDNRQFIIVVPIIIFWIAYIFHKSIMFKIDFK